MANLDKIKNNVPNEILDTINLLAKEEDRTTLEKWLSDCKKEIIFRDNQKINTYSLNLEKQYLEYILQ
ncbi:MAG TPA: hypothetical protein DEG71_06300 [Clostridiales bacterium]|nr:hypothetical protein [Clostridiales bacterium]